jgi:Tfp pilus assembly protein PilV
MRRRRGVTLIELAVSLLLMVTAVVAIVELVATSGVQRRLIQQRRLALAEVANRAERIALLPWDEATVDNLRTWQASEDLKAALPSAECHAEVTDETAAPTARRIRLAVRANDTSGQAIEYAALTFWKFPAEVQP